MTHFIPGHDFSHQAEGDEFEKLASDFSLCFDIISQRPKSSRNAVVILTAKVRIVVSLDPEVSRLEAWETWLVAMQAQYIMFRLGTQEPGSTVGTVLYRRNVSLIANGPSSDINAETWLEAFFYAVICRETEKVRYLCSISVDDLRRYGESRGTVYVPYIYKWISALQAVVLHREGFEGDLSEALELVDPDVAGVGDEESVEKLFVTEMIALMRLVERDSARFNEALAAGVAAFGEYWTANEERANDLSGTFPLGLLALACLAHDIAQVDPDFELDVVSGYLPKYLVEGAWLGEFDT